MTQVSKYPLKKEIEIRMFDIFLSSISRVNNKIDVESFINDLLSPVEKLMLAKRLSIAMLLIKGYNQRTISQILKVGLSTVNRVNSKLRVSGNGYVKVMHDIIMSEKINDLWQKIDDFITDIVPPKGRDWGKWRESRWLEKKSRHKSF